MKLILHVFKISIFLINYANYLLKNKGEIEVDEYQILSQWYENKPENFIKF